MTPESSAVSSGLVLASASPRRRDLLAGVGLRFTVLPVDIDETPHPDEPARDYVLRMAGEKCAVARRRVDGATILAADTTVIVDRQILGKPQGTAEAGQMLRLLAGRRHEVTTAYAIAHGTRNVLRAVTTEVRVRLIDEAEVQAYVATGEWQDKAGGYAIQGRAALFITDVRGSLTNVIGLPLAEVIADLRALQALPDYPAPAFGMNDDARDDS